MTCNTRHDAVLYKHRDIDGLEDTGRGHARDAMYIPDK